MQVVIQDRRAKERRRSPLRRMWIAEEDVDRRMQSRRAEERRYPLPTFSEQPNEFKPLRQRNHTSLLQR